MFIRVTLVFILLTGGVGCSGSSGTGDVSFVTDDQSAVSGTAASDTPADVAIRAGTGFVLGVSALFSNDPQGIIDVTLVNVDIGDTPEFNLLHSGPARQPFRHSSGIVTVTEPCFVGVIQYRRISALTPTGETSPLTPCSSDIPTPNNFSWLTEGKLSPGGHRLAAHLHRPGFPPIAVVYEGGQEIARYTGYAHPVWLNDNTLVLVGSKLLTLMCISLQLVV